jgi:hypothetical protein
MLIYPMCCCGCVSQAGLELESGSTGALLVSQCNVLWRSFQWRGVSGCQSFAYFWWVFFFFCQVSLQCLSKNFDSQSSCCLLPPSCCHLGSPPWGAYQHCQVGEIFILTKRGQYCWTEEAHVSAGRTASIDSFFNELYCKCPRRIRKVMTKI